MLAESYATATERLQTFLELCPAVGRIRMTSEAVGPPHLQGGHKTNVWKLSDAVGCGWTLLGAVGHGWAQSAAVGRGQARMGTVGHPQGLGHDLACGGLAEDVAEDVREPRARRHRAAEGREGGEGRK